MCGDVVGTLGVCGEVTLGHGRGSTKRRRKPWEVSSRPTVFGLEMSSHWRSVLILGRQRICYKDSVEFAILQNQRFQINETGECISQISQKFQMTVTWTQTFFCSFFLKWY